MSVWLLVVQLSVISEQAWWKKKGGKGETNIKRKHILVHEIYVQPLYHQKLFNLYQKLFNLYIPYNDENCF